MTVPEADPATAGGAPAGDRLPSAEAPDVAATWDERYARADSVWRPEANASLMQFAADLPAGRALDVGAGEGRNSVWLAGRGWQVTALDVSRVGLEKAATRAAEAGVELDRVVGDWRTHPLAPASLELVVVCYMHPLPAERELMFARAAEALVPGGHLFVTGVDAVDAGRRGPADAERLPTVDGLRASLRAFEVLRCEQVAYEQDYSVGRLAVTDVVAVARRP